MYLKLKFGWKDPHIQIRTQPDLWDWLRQARDYAVRPFKLPLEQDIDSRKSKAKLLINCRLDMDCFDNHGDEDFREGVENVASAFEVVPQDLYHDEKTSDAT